MRTFAAAKKFRHAPGATLASRRPATTTASQKARIRRTLQQSRHKPNLDSGTAKVGSPGGKAGQDVAPPIVNQVLRSSGRPLESATRALMEARFGRDFGSVRVHSGGTAAASARAVGARAYALGNHVVFGAGQYAPGTRAGERLLAHELAHVAQQEGEVSRGGSLRVGRGSDREESQAEAAARDVAAGRRTDVPATAAGGGEGGVVRRESPPPGGAPSPVPGPTETPWTKEGVDAILAQSATGRVLVEKLRGGELKLSRCADIDSDILRYIVYDPSGTRSAQDFIQDIIDDDLSAIIGTEREVLTGRKYLGVFSPDTDTISVPQGMSNLDAAGVMIHEAMHKDEPENVPRAELEKQHRAIVSTWRKEMLNTLGLTEERIRSELPSTGLTKEERDANVEEPAYRPTKVRLELHVYLVEVMVPHKIRCRPVTWPGPAPGMPGP